MNENIKKSAFRFIGFNIVESSIKRYPNSNKKGNLDVDIDLNGTIDKSKSTFILQMLCKFKDEEVFESQILAVGHFQFEGEILEELGNYFYVNSPALLFPHIRAYLAAMTSLSGLSSILIPSMNLSRLSDKLKANTKTVD